MNNNSSMTIIYIKVFKKKNFFSWSQKLVLSIKKILAKEQLEILILVRAQRIFSHLNSM